MPAPARRRSQFLRTRVAAFATGLTSASWVGTLGAVAVCLAIYAALIVGITPARFAASPTRFMANKTDGYPVLKATALRLAAGKSHKYRVIVIGDSGIREAITSPDDLQARVSAIASRQVEVIPLTAGGLTQLDAVDLCGMLRGRLRGQVLLEVSPFWMSKGEDAIAFDRTLDRIGFDSPDLADEIELAGGKRPRWFGNFFLRNIRFMLSRSDAVFRVLHPYPAPAQHIREIANDTAEAELRRDLPRVYRLTQEIHRRAPARSAVYQRMIKRLKEAGIRVTLIEAPLNPRFLTGPNDKEGLPTWVMEDYLRARSTLLRRAHVPLWDLNAECQLSAHDFRDSFHIDRSGPRERFTQALADHIAASLSAAEAGKPK